MDTCYLYTFSFSIAVFAIPTLTSLLSKREVELSLIWLKHDSFVSITRTYVRTRLRVVRNDAHTKSSAEFNENPPLSNAIPYNFPLRYSRFSRSIVRVSDDLAFLFVSAETTDRKTGGWFSRRVALSTHQRVRTSSLTAVAGSSASRGCRTNQFFWIDLSPSSDRNVSAYFDLSVVRACVKCESSEKRVRVRGMKIYLCRTRPNSSGVRRQLNLPDANGLWNRWAVRRLSAPRVRSRVAVVVFSLYTRRLYLLLPQLPYHHLLHLLLSTCSKPLSYSYYFFVCLFCVTGRAVLLSAELSISVGHARAY